MPSLSLKLSHKPVKAYYDALAEYAQRGVVHEGAVQTAFQDLLVSCGRQFQWTLGAPVCGQAAQEAADSD